MVGGANHLRISDPRECLSFPLVTIFSPRFNIPTISSPPPGTAARENKHGKQLIPLVTNPEVVFTTSGLSLHSPSLSSLLSPHSPFLYLVLAQ